jgi:biopolymer transport protein ExbD
MRRLQRATRHKSADLPVITLTPLIDTVLVLLIVFMVTTPTKIRLPTPLPPQKPIVEKNKDDEKYKAVIVAIDESGALFVDGQQVQEKKLAEKLAQSFEKSPLKAVRLDAAAAPSKAFYQVIDMLRKMDDVKIIIW